MRISVFGLGYVGTVTSACLARDGHDVIGVDIDADKVAALAEGRSSIIEPGLGQLIEDGAASGRLRAGGDAMRAVRETEVSMVSVGTPRAGDGSPELGQVHRVCREIGAAVADKGAPHTVLLRSTVPPGSFEGCVEILKAEGGGGLVHAAFVPEFLREGSAIADHYDQPLTVVGSRDRVAVDAARQVFAAVGAPVVVVEPALAEMVKYASNAWHAVKVTFANEIGRLARGWGVDATAVMDIVARDTKLNASTAYMKPGFAYGGSCLPKDLEGLLHHARRNEIPVPMLASVPGSNAMEVDRTAEEILRSPARRVAVLGLAFKPDTDDLRNSPSVELVKRLVAQGCDVSVYDPAVNEGRLRGTNLRFIRDELPNFEELLTDNGASAIAAADTVVVTHRSAEFRTLLSSVPAGTRVIDPVGLMEGPSVDPERPEAPARWPRTTEGHAGPA